MACSAIFSEKLMRDRLASTVKANNYGHSLLMAVTNN